MKTFLIFFQFGWPVLFSESAKLFGHRTQGALNYFHNCKDFHKSYAFIAAFAEAATKVREYSYIVSAPYRGLYHWIGEACNE